ncbi:aminopeptidase N [Nocardioides sp. Root151]|uniref:aminopeptidase N n=1 Tax=Nocardioides sp. Root151 TaxID=1736475 RepID=UPI0007029DD5|nr:aminopeptidase N [Nocardioides sp. Root151]KQZ70465.1 aminopeptidase N [Nocardioides sp. Root151]
MSSAETPFRSLQQTEAVARFDLLDVTSYDVRLDLATGDETFASTTTIRFTSRGGATFADLKATAVNRIVFNGSTLSPDLVERGRLPLATQAGENELVVDAVMPFRNDGEGLHAHVDPADGRRYVYGMSFMDAAPTIFACFDQPDLKAPYTFHVRAPLDWTVIGNAPGKQVEPGTWEFDETPPLSTYFVTLVAGPYHVIHENHDGIPLSLSSRQSIAQALDDDADELFTMTKQCFDEFHRLFGIRYPFGNYHQAFVPEFNAGAMENPGCVTYRDPLLFTSKVTRGERIQRATTVAHEMAHQWFGNITTPKWWDDLWLNESFAEYMGNRVTADVTQYDDAWIHNGYARRQWGLVADQRPSTHPVAGNGAFDATAALQDFDGISYAKGSTILKQLNATLGDDVFFAGVIDHFTRNRYGNATMHDLFASWERAGAGDLGPFSERWLRTAGPDTLELDRAAGVVRRTPPAGQTEARDHTIHVTTADADGRWTTTPLHVDADEITVDVPDDAAFLVDPGMETWASTLADDVSLEAFPRLIAATSDLTIRSGIWNSVRSGFHHARVSPESVVRLAEASLPTETNDDALRTLPFLIGTVAGLSHDPASALARLHAACRSLLDVATPGGTVQLGAFRGAVDSAADVTTLRTWLDSADLPDGVVVDADLRWRIMIRLASLDAISRPGLDGELAAEPTTKARVDHARAVSGRPDAESKAWAWDRFTGSAPATNYELIACGTGLWQPGQESFTEPYVDRYLSELPGAAKVHSGWVLGDVTEHFFPITSVRQSTVDRADELIARDGLDLTIRRNLVDMTDELRRRLAIRTAFDTP